jgi:hypothetical protein
MPNLGFDLRDYSTQVALEQALDAELYVLVPRRDATLPPLVPRPYSSLRPQERRLYFDTSRNPSGFVVIADVAAGTYDVHVRAAHYLPFDGSVSTPLLSPLRVDLHRDPSYPFAPSDTLIRGNVAQASGAPLTGFDVVLSDPDPAVPHHDVPLDAAGEFVIFVPEKKSVTTVTLTVFYSAGSLVVTTPLISLNRTTVVPPITVP